MPVDHKLRKEMMHTYTDKKLKHKQIKYRRKVLLWEFIVKFSYFLKRFLDIILSMLLTKHSGHKRSPEYFLSITGDLLHFTQFPSWR